MSLMSFLTGLKHLPAMVSHGLVDHRALGSSSAALFLVLKSRDHRAQTHRRTQ